jgi:uncharacterized protein YciI
MVATLGGAMRVAYWYFMKDEPDRVRAVAPDHVAYWRGLAIAGYMGGPFFDRSGGLITFEIESGEKAEQLVADDPFVRKELIESRWPKEWSSTELERSTRDSENTWIDRGPPPLMGR